MHKRKAPKNVGKLLQQLFQTVRQLLQAGVSENLILAVVYLAFAGVSLDELGGAVDGEDES